ncbi:condensation domain-containing protein [Streptomyces sp. NBC_01433]|uniref:condensation domain-containing protein n=1 Tax=Streptomyces sp. NBC_01433 TaxID=2903864 RepID=UPI00225BE9E9|nr:condensation domain-containing protein [Streptomyces sp. NBC_01433]MCX4680623.1 condensation domain-containing protein [Streptomyces sp. NBC_01433]
MSTKIEEPGTQQLSAFQAGLLAEVRRRPGTGVYVDHVLIGFTGTLHPYVLAEAWRYMTRRHFALRAGIRDRADGSAEYGDGGRPSWGAVDWRATREPVREARLRERLDRERAHGLPLDGTPLNRTLLVRCGEQDWTLAWRFSRLVVDRWSAAVVVAELCETYRALLTGRCPGPAAAPRHPGELTGRPALTRVPAARAGSVPVPDPVPPTPASPPPPDHERPPHHTTPFGAVDLRLDASATAVRRMCRTHGIVPAAVLHAAWLMLQPSGAGRPRPTCDAVLPGRPAGRPGTWSAVGSRETAVALPPRPDESRPLLPWLCELSGRLTDAVDPAHGVAGSGTADSAVFAGEAELPRPDLLDLRLQVTGADYDARPHHALALHLLPGQDLPLRLTYDRTRTSRSTAERLAARLRDLVGALAGASPRTTAAGLGAGV